MQVFYVVTVPHIINQMLNRTDNRNNTIIVSLSVRMGWLLVYYDGFTIMNLHFLHLSLYFQQSASLLFIKLLSWIQSPQVYDAIVLSWWKISNHNIIRFLIGFSGLPNCNIKRFIVLLEISRKTDFVFLNLLNHSFNCISNH